MQKKKITELVPEILGDFLSENGLELFNVEYRKEGRDTVLRVFIDKPEGAEDEYIGTDDCELVSRYLSDRLDELDPIEQNYNLEVSSPGLDRPLIREDDYRRFAGRQIEVSLFKAYNGRKNYEGTLLGLADGVLRMECLLPEPKGRAKAAAAAETVELPFELVAKAKLAVVF